MKIPTFLILASSLLFSIYANAQERLPVLHNERQPLFSEARYELALVLTGGGTVSLAYNPHTICPLNVIQSALYSSNGSSVDIEYPPIPSGLPVTFHPIDHSHFIFTNTLLNLKFEYGSPCNEPTVWQVNPIDGMGRWTNFITTGGLIGHPGCETKFNWFKIVNVDGSPNYKLVYNPEVCFPYKNTDITVVEQGGQARLAVKLDGSQDPMLIKFFRLNGAFDSS